MTKPSRWLDDPATSEALREALALYPRPSAITSEALGRLAQFDVSHPTSIIVSKAGVGLGVKSGLGVKAALVLSALGACGTGWFAMATYLEPAPATALTETSTPAPQAVAPQAVAPQAVAPQLATPEALLDEATPLAPQPKLARSTAVVSAAPPETVRHSTANSDVELTTSANAAPSLPKTQMSQLQAESELLEQARKLLTSSPRQTLVQTQLHRSQFRRPMLGLERDLLEIDAFCRLGNLPRAEALGAALFATQPQGMYANRARAILEQARAEESSTPVKDPASTSNQ